VAAGRVAQLPTAYTASSVGQRPAAASGLPILTGNAYPLAGSAARIKQRYRVFYIPIIRLINTSAQRAIANNTMLELEI
jgi:hypothetical protein